MSQEQEVDQAPLKIETFDQWMGLFSACFDDKNKLALAIWEFQEKQKKDLEDHLRRVKFRSEREQKIINYLRPKLESNNPGLLKVYLSFYNKIYEMVTSKNGNFSKDAIYELVTDTQKKADSLTLWVNKKDKKEKKQ